MKISLKKTVLKASLLIIFILIVLTAMISRGLNRAYEDIQSTVVVDRSGEPIWILPNSRGNYSIFATSVPQRFAELLLSKEDKHFYSHPGMNPIGTTQLILTKMGIGNRRSASTIDQQLAKMLLGNETRRTISNKAIETMDAMMYDLYMPKSSILLAYCNTAYFGNHIQGLKTASKAYFNKSPEKLSTEEIVQLLGTLSDPSFDNPLSESNIRKSRILAKQLGVQTVDQSFASPDTVKQNLSSFQEKEDSFELRPYIQSMKDMPKEIKTSIDSKLTTNVRQILGSIVPSLSDRDAHNMAIVIMKLPENEILTFIGSPDPTGISYGQQINMLQEPRQVASTIKPLVYAKAFEMGARPYTLIDDEEYEYKTDDGQSFYLRNYDGKFHGRITAAYALDNSINIPAVKTLSFVGVDHFADFLSTLGYADTKKVHALGIGAALGTIDMTLPDLAHLYTIFPNQGKLNSMHLFSDQSLNSSFFPQSSRQVIEPQYTQLVTKILSDRHLATDQFGYRSDLNIPLDNYALKTGTSDDYHDSWVIGFTPDFLVGVWVGNADNKSTKRLSGQSGAGEIWSQVMELMSHSTYNKKTPFAFDKIRPIGGTTNSAYEISGDDIEKARDLFIDSK